MKSAALLCIACLWAAPLAAQNIRILSLLTTDEFRDSTYDLRKPIVLNYRQTHILVYFCDPSDLARASYACRLLGLEHNWRPNGRGETVAYVNLFGGDYELQVKNLNYPDRVVSLKFHLEEAFWQKDWFVPMLVAYGLLLVGVVLYFVRIYRLRGQLRLQEVRNEIAADLHDDVGSTLGNISFLTELAKMKYAKNPVDVLPVLEKILNLFLILKELVHNCAKHSAATQATLTFKEHEGWLWARMTDNGRGFDSTLAADGNGLRNLEKRIAVLAGRLELETAVGKGVVVKLMVPF